MQDYEETSHALKRKEKIGLKLGLGKCGKTKVLYNFLQYFLFLSCFQNLIVLSPLKVTKIAIFLKKNSVKLFNGGMGTLPCPQKKFFPKT